VDITTFVATAEGGSRFESLRVPQDLWRDDGMGHRIQHSAAYASPAVQLVELPARQLVVVLSGVIEVETTDGQCRQWRAGEVFLPADVTGQGHRTRCLGGAVTLLFAPLPDGFAF